MTPNDQIVLLDATVPRWDDRSCAALRQALSVVGDGEVLEAPIALYVPTHNGEVLWEVTTSTRGKGLQLTNPEGRTLSRDEFVRHATRTKVTYERLPVTVLEEHEDGVTWDVQPTEAGFASTLVLQVRADKEGETWMRVELERFDPTRLSAREVAVLALQAGCVERHGIIEFATSFHKTAAQMAKILSPCKAEQYWKIEGTAYTLLEDGAALANGLVDQWGAAGLNEILNAKKTHDADVDDAATEPELEHDPAGPDTDPAALAAAPAAEGGGLAASARAVIANLAAVAPVAWINNALRAAQANQELITLASVRALEKEAGERAARGEFDARDVADALAAFEAAEGALRDAVLVHTAKRPRVV